MNRPPNEFTPISADALRIFLRRVFEHVGVPNEKAAFLTECLVENDLRGVFSHGTQQAMHYVHSFLQQEVNPNPNVRIVEESLATMTVDGDGGLGYFPAHTLTTNLIHKAQQLGISAGVARNHGHIGAAGIYARLPLEQDLFCYVTSGHQLHVGNGGSFLRAAGGSPMAFGIPTTQKPPFVLDFGAMQDVYSGAEHLDTIAELAPSVILRSFGLGCVCQALGGFLCGVPLHPEQAQRQWTGADQGTFIIIVDLNRFLPIDQFKAEMDAYAQQIGSMEPLPGYDRAMPAGTLEWERQQRYTQEGIPIGLRHAEILRNLAARFGLDSPL